MDTVAWPGRHGGPDSAPGLARGDPLTSWAGLGVAWCDEAQFEAQMGGSLGRGANVDHCC